MAEKLAGGNQTNRQRGKTRAERSVQGPQDRAQSDPKFKFKGVHTNRKFTIKPGPNNPVGVVWIDLTKESYGIHGTPDPERIGKTYSHGCIRLTNLDALDLTKRMRKGMPVDFVDEPSALPTGGTPAPKSEQ